MFFDAAAAAAAAIAAGNTPFAMPCGASLLLW
jgi:hypothetical protein